MYVKQIPNLLTGLRFGLTVLLLFLPLPGAAFTVLYLACGLTDILDGWLARRLHASTAFGARLDSAADFCLVCTMLYRLWPLLTQAPGVLLWVAAISLLRLSAACVAKIRFGRFGFLHTRANKLTGLLLFLYPLSLSFTRTPAGLLFLCLIAALSAVEEMLIECTATEWDANRTSIFQRKRCSIL